MWDNYIMGEGVLFYIKTVNGWLPVCALTDAPMSRDTGRIETTARGSNGNKSYLPAMHDYSISLSGILTKKAGVVSYNDLDILQENRVIFDWRSITADGYISKTGSAFITNLTLNTATREWVSFSCTLSPAEGGMKSLVLIWTENGFNAVSEDGNNNVVRM